MIEVRDAGRKGLGVFATVDIPLGQSVGRSIAKPFNHAQEMPRELDDLPFAWRDGEDALAFGPVQFANHSEYPNCFLERDFAKATIALVAKRDIEAGEELTYHYDCPLWFEPVKEQEHEIADAAQVGHPG